jgi:hypothetical protein
MKRLIAAAAMLAASTVAASAQQVGGNYNVEGTNLDGSAYSGTATITWLDKSTCSIAWATGDTSSKGYCMQYGPAFSAAFSLDEQTFGLLIYRVLGTGELEGIWTITGQEGVGTERMTPQ